VRLEGWQQARPSTRPSFETRRKGGAPQDEVGEGLARMGAKPKFGTCESFGAMIAAEIPKWAEAVHAASVRPD
jgi:hypothetical protein